MNHGDAQSESKFSLSRRAWRDGLAVQRDSALAEDLCSVSSTHVKKLTTACNSSFLKFTC